MNPLNVRKLDPRTMQLRNPGIQTFNSVVTWLMDFCSTFKLSWMGSASEKTAQVWHSAREKPCASSPQSTRTAPSSRARSKSSDSDMWGVQQVPELYRAEAAACAQSSVCVLAVCGLPGISIDAVGL